MTTEKTHIIKYDILLSHLKQYNNKNRRREKMSTYHGGPVTQKPISEIAKYIKNLIPANIPETYALKPMFENVASEKV